MKETIAIIGGYGGMGRFFAKLFSSEGYKTIIAGPDEVRGKAAAAEIGAVYEKDNASAAKKADIVMISVPIDATLAVIKEVAPNVREGALLMDVTSVKEEPCKAMAAHAKAGVEIIGSHPVFGHRIGGIEGQVFILTPVRGEKYLKWLRNFLEKHKARVYETTPQQHDETMAVVQGLTHFSYIAIGKTLQELDFDIKKSRNFSSPIYELMLDMIGRIIGQSPELYASIQTQNPRTTKVHKKFIEVAEELATAVEKKDEKKFRAMMSSAAKHFDDVERAMGRSDKAIASLVSELSHLKQSVGKELCLRHMYSGQMHLGIVKSVSADWVVLEDAGKESKLNISNIQILSDEERIEYKKKKYGTVKRDFSVVLGSDVREEFIAQLLRDYDETVTGVEVKDVFVGQQIGDGKKSVCFSVELINSDVKEAEKKVNGFLTRLGGRIR
jgi:prephenate dehydrogenase